MFTKFARICLARLLASLILSLAIVATSTAEAPKPNVVIIFCDDLGFGDLGCYGHPTIRTPNLDRMATEGLKLTSFYVASPVCTPSRAALMTGRLPIRSGMCSSRRRVLFPDSAGGLPAEEITIAQLLKSAGYATACVGKWHLGHLPPYLPTTRGFDSYFGIPYSNDMDRVNKQDYPKGRDAFWAPKIEYWDVPLLRDNKEIERPADQNTITRRYTEEAIKFIGEKKDDPFFLYLAHSMPHVPLFAGEKFKDTSPRGLYGDVIEELDWSTGQILKALKENGLDEKTLVVFTSDNGPWLIFNTHGGSGGLLRDGKGSTWDGGMRVPCLIRWPGQIEAGRVSDAVTSSMDLLPTCAALAGVEAPKDRPLDGYDLSAFLMKGDDCPREEMFYYRDDRLYAVRKGPFKAHFVTQPAYGGGGPQKHTPAVLFHLGHDPSEKFNIAADHPEVVAELTRLAEKHTSEMEPGETQLEKRIE